MRNPSHSIVHVPFKSLSGVALALVAAAGLSACGGGSFPTALVDPLAPASQSDLEKVALLYGIDTIGIGGDGSGDGGAAGAAGDGGPLKRAVVTLTDAKGNFVTGQTDDNGKFLLKYKTANFTAPLVLRVIDAGGNILSSVTDESAATGKAIRASINPLTDKITSDVIPASVSGTDKAFSGASVDTTKLVKAKADLLTSINAALGTAGIADATNFDAVKSIYGYDGKGVDAIIESISHARDSSTGATQLRAKLVGLSTSADGTVAPTLITASTPLPTTAVALSTSPALTFDKLNAWVTEANRCLALTSTARSTDADCADANNGRLISASFKSNSKDLAETYRTLYSESDRSAIQGSTLSNPTVLYTTPSTGSSVDDNAVVEFTVNQPRTGPLSSNAAVPLQYTITVVFRRDDSLTKAKATNWVAYGNQRNFDLSINPRFNKSTQINSLRQANSSGGIPSRLSAGLAIGVQLVKFDVATRTYVSSNLRAVRVTGPGLPTAGLVLSPSSVPGTNYLTLNNKVGRVDTTAMISAIAGVTFNLNSVALDGSALYPGLWNAANVGNADTPLADFSALQAYSRYTFEIFLNSNPSNTTPDAVETARIQAPLAHPATTSNLQRNDLTPSLALVTAPEAGGCNFDFAWTNNPNAAAVESVYIYGGKFDVTPAIITTIGSSVNASIVGTRASSAKVTAANTTAAGCGTNAIPALLSTPNGSTYREIGIRSTQARAQTYDIRFWSN